MSKISIVRTVDEMVSRPAPEEVIYVRFHLQDSPEKWVNAEVRGGKLYLNASAVLSLELETGNTISVEPIR
jgi:hypothetical protein